MNWKVIAIGALAGLFVGYLRTAKTSGGKTPATPSGF